jgi:hypothetical protein
LVSIDTLLSLLAIQLAILLAFFRVSYKFLIAMGLMLLVSAIVCGFVSLDAYADEFADSAWFVLVVGTIAASVDSFRSRRRNQTP